MSLFTFNQITFFLEILIQVLSITRTEFKVAVHKTLKKYCVDSSIACVKTPTFRV